MKGMMVALLVIVMTGTVIGQQPNQQDNAGKPGSFVLWLNNQLINQLKTNPDGLLADVPANAKGKLIEVLVRYEKVHSDVRDQVQPKQGRFNLWLDDELIQQLIENEQGLVATIPKALQDKIMEVVLKYEAPDTSKHGHFHPRAPGTGSSSSHLADRTGSLPGTKTNPGDQITKSIAPQNNWQSTRRLGDEFSSRGEKTTSPPPVALTLEEKLRRLNGQSRGQFPSAKEARDQTALSQQQKYGSRTPKAEQGYVTPPRSIQPDNTTGQYPKYPNQNANSEFRPRFDLTTQGTVQTGRDGFGRSQPATDRRTFGEFDDSRRRLTDLPVVNASGQTSKPGNAQSDAEFQRELMRRETERLRAARIAQEQRDTQQKFADEKARYEQELYLQRLRNDSLARTGNDSITPRSPDYLGDRYAMRSDQLPIQNPTYQFPNRRSESFTALADYDYSKAPSRNKLTTPPRIAQNGGLNGYRAEISGPNNNAIQTGGANSIQKPTAPLGDGVDHNDRAYGFMFFMLMFSIGLNVYLAWISRGFYVRYNELADELRETFTSTV